MLLREAGHEVIGVFMRHGEPAATPAPTGAAADSSPIYRCRSSVGPATSRAAARPAMPQDARRVADRLDIPFYAIDFQEEFGRIIDYFVDEYTAARTPNPCVMCNNWLKFGRLFDYADSVGAEFVATGHYARLLSWRRARRLARPVPRRRPTQGSVVRAVRHRRELLLAMLLPVGGLSQGGDSPHGPRDWACAWPTRRTARRFASCPRATTPAFIRRKRGESTIGRRDRDQRRPRRRHARRSRAFTIGQRKGLGIALGEPRFVVRLERDTQPRRARHQGRTGPARTYGQPHQLAGRRHPPSRAAARSRFATTPSRCRARSRRCRAIGWTFASTSRSMALRPARPSSATTATGSWAAAGSNEARRCALGRAAASTRVAVLSTQSDMLDARQAVPRDLVTVSRSPRSAAALTLGWLQVRSWLNGRCCPRIRRAGDGQFVDRSLAADRGDLRVHVPDGRAGLRQAVVSGVHVERPGQLVQPDRHELAAGQRPRDRARRRSWPCRPASAPIRTPASPPAGSKPTTWPAATCRA